MNELFDKLLEAEVLTEETKSELESAFQTQITEAVEAAKTEASADVRAELTEQWVSERDTLVESVDTKVSEYLSAELNELREDIVRFRDLEAEYAEKLVEERASMRDELKVDLGQLVEKLDSFLEIRLNSELEELREDIAEQKKNDFGRRMFEAFVAEYSAGYADDESLEGTLQETRDRLADTEIALEEAEETLASMERSQKLASVLAPLTGKQRDVMEAILRNVSTDMLDEGYKTFIGRVITESNEVVSEEGNEVLTEDAVEKTLTEGKVVSGNDVELMETNKREDNASKLSNEAKIRLQRQAGIIS